MEKQYPIVQLCEVVPRLPELSFAHPISWIICPGEHWAVLGRNGAGKTLLADFLQRKHALKSGEVKLFSSKRGEATIKSIAFKDIYSLTDTSNSYYQQRWHSSDSEESVVVSDLINTTDIHLDAKHFLDYFNFNELLNKRLIHLSSGELRKFLILRVLLTLPDILILDNPFIGLDVESRNILIKLLQDVVDTKRIQIVLLLSDPTDLPEFITHVLPVKERECLSPQSRQKFVKNSSLIQNIFPEIGAIPEFPLFVNGFAEHEVTLRMENVEIKYGNRTILRDLNWEVKNNEKWALSGANGAGKSTLLSLVYADNPQSYANTLYLFDKKRGSGESIWDIKKRIGYVSPEMHWYYNENVAVLKVVGSGFFDSVGLYRKCTDEQFGVAMEWMKVFGIEHLRDRLFLSLSSGEQRLVLLARAFVKSPDLLVLDEPLHGLDACNKEYVIRVIEQYCSLPQKTLIFVTHYLEELPPSIDKHFRLNKN